MIVKLPTKLKQILQVSLYFETFQLPITVAGWVQRIHWSFEFVGSILSNIKLGFVFAEIEPTRVVLVFGIV